LVIANQWCQLFSTRGFGYCQSTTSISTNPLPQSIPTHLEAMTQGTYGPWIGPNFVVLIHGLDRCQSMAMFKLDPWPSNFKGLRWHDFWGIPCIWLLFFLIIDDAHVQGFQYQLYEFLLHKFT